MRPIAPRTGLPEVTLAEDQPEFKPITVALWSDPTGACGCLTRWRPSPEELTALLSGEDVFVAITTGGHPMQPVHVQVGAGVFVPINPG